MGLATPFSLHGPAIDPSLRSAVRGLARAARRAGEPAREHRDEAQHDGGAQEAEARVDGLLKGKIKTIAGEEVLAYRGRR